ncbi:MCP four helix bundle domain-containing protein [Chitinilyticum piscinae]|uniref:MCP four helix bundle domain-containing protein n=1 Tax=Chitinilyticum piscinae TaxID=2866724 RepID=A0A8J7KGB1_9NEIS|nr:MCP four helix bundle domain-containing protein [Chitinilyticum piscinae]MBE9610299.1 MCP four helix bundle domain-containing protein [Chitinilyticum piscinae]
MTYALRQRFWAVVAGAVMAVLVTGLIGFFSSQQISEELEFTDENIIRSLAILSSVERDFLLIRVNALYHLSYQDASKRAPHENTIRHNIAQINEHLDAYARDLVVNRQDGELLQRDRQLLGEYLTALEKVLAASNAGKREEALVVVESEWKPAGERLTAAFADHTRYKERLVDQVVQQSMHSGRRNAWILLLVTAAGVLLVLAVAWLFRRSLQHTQTGR